MDQTHFAALRRMGVNRLSMGVQSFDDAELRWLGRIHNAAEAEAAFRAARVAGFANINLDFMFGLPGQDPATWARTLAQAIDLAPEHLSLYSLTVEAGTPLAEQVTRGLTAEPDDDLAADLYLAAGQMLAAGGYEQYEISNWARTESANQRISESEWAPFTSHSLIRSSPVRLPPQPCLLAQRAVPGVRRGGAQLRETAKVVECQAGAGVHPPGRGRPGAGTRGRGDRPAAGDG